MPNVNKKGRGIDLGGTWGWAGRVGWFQISAEIVTKIDGKKYNEINYLKNSCHTFLNFLYIYI